MKVLVIGATGATGTLAVERLLERGDDVTAFARDPMDVTNKHPRLRVEKGDARDAASVSRAVQGQDAVLVAFGPRSLGKTNTQETLAKNLVAAMKQHGVSRLVNLSAWGVGPPDKRLNPVVRVAMWLMLRHVYADKRRGEAILKDSGLDVVQVRPGRLVNTPARGGVKESPTGEGLSPVMTRADLAGYMVAQLSSPTWVNKSVVIGY